MNWLDGHDGNTFNPLLYTQTVFLWVSLTFCLYPECSSDQGKQRGIEHHRSIAV